MARHWPGRRLASYHWNEHEALPSHDEDHVLASSTQIFFSPEAIRCAINISCHGSPYSHSYKCSACERKCGDYGVQWNMFPSPIITPFCAAPWHVARLAIKGLSWAVTFWTSGICYKLTKDLSEPYAMQLVGAKTTAPVPKVLMAWTDRRGKTHLGTERVNGRNLVSSRTITAPITVYSISSANPRSAVPALLVGIRRALVENMKW